MNAAPDHRPKRNVEGGEDPFLIDVWSFVTRRASWLRGDAAGANGGIISPSSARPERVMKASGSLRSGVESVSMYEILCIAHAASRPTGSGQGDRDVRRQGKAGFGNSCRFSGGVAPRLASRLEFTPALVLVLLPGERSKGFGVEWHAVSRMSPATGRWQQVCLKSGVSTSGEPSLLC